MTRLKKCGRCRLDQDTKEFTLDSTRYDSLYPICKTCQRKFRTTPPGVKKCTKCKETRLYTQFHRSKNFPDGYFSWCVFCKKESSKEYRTLNRDLNLSRKKIYRDTNRDEINKGQVDRRKNGPAEALLNSARARAKKLGLPFNITLDYVRSVWPVDGNCPILGVPLVVGTGHPTNSSPSIDKIIPSKGYVVGNIAVISHKANMIKQDEFNPAVFRRMADWIEEMIMKKEIL